MKEAWPRHAGFPTLEGVSDCCGDALGDASRASQCVCPHNTWSHTPPTGLTGPGRYRRLYRRHCRRRGEQLAGFSSQSTSQSWFGFKKVINQHGEENKKHPLVCNSFHRKTEK